MITQKKKWFQRYHWFFSSNGILVVAGKNQRNNKTIVKRYLRPNDLVVSNDFLSPIAVVRNDQKISPLPAETIFEAAEFVVCLSEFWKNKTEEGRAFYANSSQVSFDSEKISVSGEKKYLEKIKPRLSVGILQENVWDASIIYGPPTAVKRRSPFMITLIPGDDDPKILANDIKKNLLLKITPEIRSKTEAIEAKEFEKLIPFSRGKLVS